MRRGSPWPAWQGRRAPKRRASFLPLNPAGAQLNLPRRSPRGEPGERLSKEVRSGDVSSWLGKFPSPYTLA